ncbi:MAG TPA: cytochrome P450 [Acidimicrobiia bacterium]|nr:cytochrome P450 [Acidimicrobiia bacterium]
MATTTPTTQIDESQLADLNDPDAFVGGIPHETFAYWRAHDPVHWTEHPTEDPYWSVTTYDDVVAVNRDAQAFSSGRGGVFMMDPDEEMLASLRLLMLNMDPPQHTRYRLLVSRAFTPKHIRDLDEFIQRCTHSIVDEMIEKGEADFVVDLAAELPLQVIAEIIGVPQEDRHLVFDWSNRMIGSDDPEFQISPDAAGEAQVELYAYCQALCEERRRSPRDDILTALINAEVDGDRLDDLELNTFFMLLSVAGNETTRNLIAHGMHHLFQFPDEHRKLLADRSLLGSGVEEMLRVGSPVLHFRRTATRDLQLGDQSIAEGDKILMWYPSANRDEKHFEDPMAFRVDRQPNEHIAFGGRGPHYCLGANLARSEIRHMFSEILERMPDMRQAGEPQRLRSNFIGGIKHLPVEFSPGPRLF